ncbi:uncharacterized protein LOC125050938 [Pieris napi]|uniref:uncharacterized protein LOC125050938 n=1 Tax=Pieris napi TaxID=78633 RepID=UPI001FBB553E|nr:uncharacterized protein LOC125050938 [Pieris napi]
MQYFIIFFMFLKVTECAHVGSSLFHNQLTKISKFDCWNERDLAKLRARKVFEDMIPPNVVPAKITQKYTKNILRYFRRAFHLVNKAADTQTSFILKEALADSIGAHMRSEILPAARFAYYAGFLPYRRVRDLHNYYDNIKLFLNTQGLGWRKPNKVPVWSNLTVETIQIGSGQIFDPCVLLVSKRDTNSCIHVPPPKMDDHCEPTAVALPVKTNSLLSLTSPKSENAVLKYYTAASRCLLKRSPKGCRHADFVSYNNEIWHWVKRDVAPHLMDEKLYAAYGGILRVAAAAQSYGKGISRRNLFTFQEAGVSKWQPWKALKNSYVYINADWTPYCCVVGILLIGLAVCVIQILYSYLFGDDDGCHCRGRPKSSTDSKDVEYAKVDSNIPAMLPPQKNIFYSMDRAKHASVSSKVKTSSLSSARTQRVYDLNENKEKMMDIIMSESSDTSVESADKNDDSDNVIDVGCVGRSKSPPKIETSLDEVKICKGSARRPEYSTSATRSGITYQDQATESVWSGSDRSSSGTITTDSSKSRCRRSKSSRDLAWARRVISKHSLTKTTSATTLDCHSFTTPPSRR